MDRREHEEFHKVNMKLMASVYNSKNERGILLSVNPDHGIAVGAFGMDEEDYKKTINILNNEINPGVIGKQVKVNNIEIGIINTALGIVFGTAVSILLWELWGLIQ